MLLQETSEMLDHYVKVQRFITDSATITPIEYRVFMVLKEHNMKGDIHPSLATIAKLVNRCKRTVQYVISSLVRKGFVRKERRTNVDNKGWAANRYYLNEQKETWIEKEMPPAELTTEGEKDKRKVDALITLAGDHASTITEDHALNTGHDGFAMHNDTPENASCQDVSLNTPGAYSVRTTGENGDIERWVHTEDASALVTSVADILRTEYRTKTGRPLPDADCTELAEDAIVRCRTINPEATYWQISSAVRAVIRRVINHQNRHHVKHPTNYFKGSIPNIKPKDMTQGEVRAESARSSQPDMNDIERIALDRIMHPEKYRDVLPSF